MLQEQTQERIHQLRTATHPLPNTHTMLLTLPQPASPHFNDPSIAPQIHRLNRQWTGNPVIQRHSTDHFMLLTTPTWSSHTPHNTHLLISASSSVGHKVLTTNWSAGVAEEWNRTRICWKVVQVENPCPRPPQPCTVSTNYSDIYI